MKNGLKRWVGRVPDLSAVFTRFPIPTALMAVFTLAIIFEDALNNFDQFGYLMAGLVLAGYLCVNYVISRESRKQAVSVFIQGGIVLSVLGLAWFAKAARLEPAMAIGASILILGNAVRFRQGRDDLRVWDFTHKIWTGVGFAVLGSIIFTLGIFAIEGALRSLFGLNIRSFLQELILPIGLAFLAPLYWMSTIPATDEPVSDLTDNPGFVSKAVGFLGTWLLSPLTLIYALILIAYGLKIILAGELPKGEIAALTTPFLLIGTLTWLLLDPPFIRNKLLAKLFRRGWFFLSLPAAMLLAISVAVRVSQYGLTDERMALILCCLWALGVGLWFCFAPREKRDIRIIPGLAALLLTFGTFTSLRLSHMDQTSRAKSAMKAVGIMSEAGVIKPLDEIDIRDDDAARKARGALDYLAKNNEHKTFEALFEGAENVPESFNLYGDKWHARLKLENYKPRGRYAMSESYDYSHSEAVIAMRNKGWVTRTLHLHWNRETKQSSNILKADLDVTFKGGKLYIAWPEKAIDTTFDFDTWQTSLPKIGDKFILESPQVLLGEGAMYTIEMYVESLSYKKYDYGEHTNMTFQIIVTEQEPISTP